jgi:hypothetical protein
LVGYWPIRKDMKKTILIIWSLLILLPVSVSATIIQFESAHPVENGQSAVTEVMVSEVFEKDLDIVLGEFKTFLNRPDNGDAPVKFIYSAPDEKVLQKKDWNNLISQEEIAGRLDGIHFEERVRVEIPEELFLQDGRIPQSEGLGLSQEFEAYYRKNYKLRRITLVASRTIINGAVASLGFIAGGMPTAPAMVVGSLTGLMSGTMQVLAKPLIEFLSTNKYEMKAKKLLGLKTGPVTASKFLSSQLKWFSTEFLFLAILDVARFSLNQLPPTTMGAEVLSLGTTSIKSLASQGLVDTSVAKEYGPRIAQAVEAGDFAKAAKLRFRTEIIGFSASMTWAGAAITDMMGLPIGNVLFTAMGTAGGGNHLRLILKDKMNNIGESIRSTLGCNWFYKKRPPMP